MIAFIVIAVLLSILVSLFRRDCLRRAQHYESDLQKKYAELSETAQKHQVQLWAYDVQRGIYLWLDDERKQFNEELPTVFSQHYTPSICQHIAQTIQSFIRGSEEQKKLRIGLSVKDGSRRYYTIDMSVFTRTPDNDVALIIALQTDFTEQHLRETRNRETRLRYESIKSALEAFDNIYTRQEADDAEELRLLELQEEAKGELTDYISKIELVTKIGGMRMALYTPDNHTLLVINDAETVQLTVPAARALRFVDSGSMKDVQRLFTAMDRRTPSPFDAVVKTVIPHREAAVLSLQVSFIPVYEATVPTGEPSEARSTPRATQQVEYYFGMLLDVSPLKAMELKLTTETIRARQLEGSKDSLLNDMSEKLRTHLDAIAAAASQLKASAADDNSQAASLTALRDNATQLLSLIS